MLALLPLVALSAHAADAPAAPAVEVGVWAGLPSWSAAGSVDAFASPMLGFGVRGVGQSSVFRSSTCSVFSFVGGCRTTTTRTSLGSVVGRAVLATPPGLLPPEVSLRLALGGGYGYADTFTGSTRSAGIWLGHDDYSSTSDAGWGPATSAETSLRAAVTPHLGLSTVLAWDTVWTEQQPMHRVHVGLGTSLRFGRSS
jgi:hypothetical protein